MSNKNKSLALLALLPLLLTACTARDIPLIGRFFPEPEVPSTAITVWGLYERKDIMQTVIDKFTESNPKVVVTYDDRSVLTPVEYKERAFERAVDTTGPHVILVHNSWIPRMISNSLLDPVPSTLFDTTSYTQTFYPVAADSAMVSGTAYGLPAYYDGLVLVYNKDHFEEIGQELAPTAWEEFRKLALDLTIREEGNLTRGGAAIGTSNNILHFSDILGLMWSQAGVALPNAVDGKAAQDATTFYTNFVKEDQVWSEAMPEATTAFVEGKTSMIFVPSWQILRILENVEDVSSVGVAPVPQAISTRPANWGSFWVYVVPKNRTDEEKEAAWQYVNYVTGEEATRNLFSENSKIRQFGTPFARASMQSELTTDPYLASIIASASTAKSAEIAAASGNNRQETALRTAISKILAETLTVEEALVEAKAELIN